MIEIERPFENNTGETNFLSWTKPEQAKPTFSSIEEVEQFLIKINADPTAASAEEIDKALTFVYDKYHRLVRFVILNKTTQNYEAAAELTQETFLKFFKKIISLKDKPLKKDTFNLKNYLLTIAANLCKNYFRRFDRKESKQTPLDDFEYWDYYFGTPNTTDEQRFQNQLSEVLLAALQTMSQNSTTSIYVDILILKYLYSYRDKEITKKLHPDLTDKQILKKVNSTKSLLVRARKKLGKVLIEMANAGKASTVLEYMSDAEIRKLQIKLATLTTEEEIKNFIQQIEY